MSSQASGANTIVLVSIRPRPATAGKRATEGQRSRINASFCSGGITPEMACLRTSTMEAVPFFRGNGFTKRKYRPRPFRQEQLPIGNPQQYLPSAAHRLRLPDGSLNLTERKLLHLRGQDPFLHQMT